MKSDEMGDVNGAGASRKDQIPVVVETVTKSSTIKTFAAAQPLHDSDASKVTSTGAGLQSAPVSYTHLTLPTILRV